MVGCVVIVVGVAVEAVVEIVVAIVANVIAYDYVGKALSMMLRRQLQLYLVGTGC